MLRRPEQTDVQLSKEALARLHDALDRLDDAVDEVRRVVKDIQGGELA